MYVDVLSIQQLTSSSNNNKIFWTRGIYNKINLEMPWLSISWENIFLFILLAFYFEVNSGEKNYFKKAQKFLRNLSHIPQIVCLTHFLYSLVILLSFSRYVVFL